jgi:hypothetical protein
VDYSRLSDFRLQAAEAQALAAIERVESAIEKSHADSRSLTPGRPRLIDTTTLLPLYDASDRAHRDLESIRAELLRRSRDQV